MEIFDFRFQVAAPVAALSKFHFQPGILKALTPPLTYMQVRRFDPLSDGSIGDFTIWMGPIPVRWVAEHSEVTPFRFVDTQIAGPMKSWRHTHTLTAIDDKTSEVHDHIEYEHDRGLRGLWSRLLFPRPALLVLFSYRRWVTRRETIRLARNHTAGD